MKSYIWINLGIWISLLLTGVFVGVFTHSLHWVNRFFWFSTFYFMLWFVILLLAYFLKRRNVQGLGITLGVNTMVKLAITGVVWLVFVKAGILQAKMEALLFAILYLIYTGFISWSIYRLIIVKD